MRIEVPAHLWHASCEGMAAAGTGVHGDTCGVLCTWHSKGACITCMVVHYAEMSSHLEAPWGARRGALSFCRLRLMGSWLKNLQPQPQYSASLPRKSSSAPAALSRFDRAGTGCSIATLFNHIIYDNQ